MASTGNSRLDEWIERNTFACPVGKITRRMCEELRKRPSLGDKAARGYCGSTKFNPKPTVCEKCAGWQEYLHATTDWGDEMPGKQEALVEHKEKAGFRYKCEKHGPHNGGKIGKAFSVKCPKCVNEHRASRMREGMQRKKQGTESDIVQRESNPACVQDKPPQVNQISVPTPKEPIEFVHGPAAENSIKVIDENPWREMGLVDPDCSIKTTNVKQVLPQKDVVILDFSTCPWLLEYLKDQTDLPLDVYIKRHFLERMPPEVVRRILMTQVL